ncbi:MAG: tetratricopeptide repeat protein [Anaerolineae bacterium]|jgi:DNA-binding SARP family transcriptional activator
MSKERAQAKLYLLGTPRIVVAGTPRRLPYQKVTGLLAYLAITARVHSRTALATLLWGHVDDRRANSSLRNALYVIRRELEPADWLSVSRHKVGIDSAHVWLDFDHFRQVITDKTPGIPALNEALALWRGPFLDGCLVKEAPEFNTWVSGIQAQIDRYHLEGYLALSRAHERAGQQQEALDSALNAVALDPLYEAGQRQVMRIQLQMGRRSAALQQYEQCRATLLEQLGVLPDSRTQALHRQAITQDSAPAGSLARRKSSRKRQVFVGRQREMATLNEHLRAVRRNGRGRLVLIEGEAGVGKTRLVTEWLDTLCDVHILNSRCFEAERSIPYHPWIDMLRTSMRHTDWRQLKLSTLWLSELTQLIPELRGSYPDLPQPAPPDPDLTRGRLGEAIHQWLRALGQRQPICLFLDDVQWIDRASLAVFGYVLRHCADLPLLAIGTQRREEIDPAWQRTQNLLSREGLGHTMSLYRLSFSEVAAMARNIGFHATDPDAFLKRLFRETEGNPLFVVKILQSLQEVDVDPLGEWPIPPTIKDLIQTSLDRLSTPAYQMLSIAAVIGRNFEVQTLQSVTDQPPGHVLSALEEGLSAGLIMEDERGYDFSHDQIRGVLYGQISQARRRHLHYRLAEAMELHHRDDLSPFFGLLANHFEAAGEAERAHDYALRAAKRAVELYADEDALGWYNRALALGGTAPPQLVPGMASQVIPFQQPCFSTMQSLDTLSLIYHQQGLIHQRNGRYEVAQERFQQALARASKRGHLDEQAAAHSLLSYLGYLRGDYESLKEHALRSVDLAKEAGASAIRAEGLRNLGIAAYATGDYQQALEIYQESLDMSCTIGDRIGMAKCHNNIGFALRTLRRFDDAVAAFEQALALHKATGSIEGAAGVLANIGSVYAHKGDIVPALAHLTQAIELSNESHATWIMVKAYRTLGNTYLQDGQWDQALNAAEKARDLAETLGSKEDLGAAYRLMGEIAAANPESALGSADRYFERGLAMLQEVGEEYELGRLKTSLETYRSTQQG